jgi:hypothetical protein
LLHLRTQTARSGLDSLSSLAASKALSHAKPCKRICAANMSCGASDPARVRSGCSCDRTNGLKRRTAASSNAGPNNLRMLDPFHVAPMFTVAGRKAVGGPTVSRGRLTSSSTKHAHETWELSRSAQSRSPLFGSHDLQSEQDEAHIFGPRRPQTRKIVLTSQEARQLQSRPRVRPKDQMKQWDS